MKVQGKGEPVHTWWVQQFCDIFGKKGDAWHMILGDNPAGHGFVLRDLVLIELSGHAPPSSLGERGRGGLKISEKILLGAGSEILILVVVVVVGESHNFEVKIKTT